MSVRKAAEHFKVPKSTVGDRVTGKREIVVGRGRKPALPLRSRKLKNRRHNGQKKMDRNTNSG
jgi:lysine/ornithine N-monooxygenase